MSQENVELHHQAIDALNRRDLRALLALSSADVQAVSLLVAVEGSFRGHDGIRRWYASLLEAFPDYIVEVVEERDLGRLTLAHMHARAHGAGSDIPIELTHWQLAEWRDKKLVWWRVFLTEAEALEAAALRE